MITTGPSLRSSTSQGTRTLALAKSNSVGKSASTFNVPASVTGVKSTTMSDIEPAASLLPLSWMSTFPSCGLISHPACTCEDLRTESRMWKTLQKLSVMNGVLAGFCVAILNLMSVFCGKASSLFSLMTHLIVVTWDTYSHLGSPVVGSGLEPPAYRNSLHDIVSALPTRLKPVGPVRRTSSSSNSGSGNCSVMSTSYTLAPPLRTSLTLLTMKVMRTLLIGKPSRCDVSSGVYGSASVSLKESRDHVSAEEVLGGL
mmetsp:Transcript_111644/g.326535  ORF Transcript_111644/g.326535 Transcript_111644/m.326535 type:complete len:257 (-) Transcript_111644:812-1582(-)